MVDILERGRMVLRARPDAVADWLLANMTTEQKKAFKAEFIPDPTDREKLAALIVARDKISAVAIGKEQDSTLADLNAKIAALQAAIKQ